MAIAGIARTNFQSSRIVGTGDVGGQESGTVGAHSKRSRAPHLCLPYTRRKRLGGWLYRVFTCKDNGPREARALSESPPRGGYAALTLIPPVFSLCNRKLFQNSPYFYLT
jgi:hypothetical protein